MVSTPVVSFVVVELQILYNKLNEIHKSKQFAIDAKSATPSTAVEMARLKVAMDKCVELDNVVKIDMSNGRLIMKQTMSLIKYIRQDILCFCSPGQAAEVGCMFTPLQIRFA